MDRRRDWTAALDDLMIEHWRGAGCLLCGATPVSWMDLLEVGHYAVSYALCAGCRTKDPEAARVRQALTERYAPLIREEKT